MILSEATLSILKNFAALNSGVVLNAGNVQRTWTADMNVLLQVETEESFPVVFGIYDLSKFLVCLTTLNSPELDFHEDHVVIKDSMLNIKYYGCQPSLIVSPPNKSLTIPNPDVTFNFPQSAMTKILRLASINDLSTLSVVGRSGKLLVQAYDKNNNESNVISTEIGDWQDDDFECMLKLTDLNQKVVADDYLVKIKKNTFAQFISVNNKVQYSVVLKTK